MAGVALAAALTAALLWFRAVPTPLLSVTARLLVVTAIALAIALGVDGTQTL